MVTTDSFILQSEFTFILLSEFTKSRNHLNTPITAILKRVAQKERERERERVAARRSSTIQVKIKWWFRSTKYN
jgi:hypothetical protein